MSKTVKDIMAQKGATKIVAITAYDSTMATLFDRGGMDILLVGDSAAMVMMGHDSTRRIGMDEMCLFTSSVAAANPEALIVADMPEGSYPQTGDGGAINAQRLVSAGAGAVKIEGGVQVAEIARRIIARGVPVMGHIGFCPQTDPISGASKRCGTNTESVDGLVSDAQALEAAGVFSIVLEMVSMEGAARVTESVKIPTIGIGSGPSCDGQVLVGQDMLGMYERLRPSFAKRYLDLAAQISEAASKYKDEVRSGEFPSKDHGFSMENKN